MASQTGLGYGRSAQPEEGYAKAAERLNPAPKSASGAWTPSGLKGLPFSKSARNGNDFPGTALNTDAPGNTANRPLHGLGQP